MFDLIELFTHWHAGRSQRQLAESLGIDRKTIAKYLAPAIAESLIPGGDPVTERGWTAHIVRWFPEVADPGLRATTWPGIEVHRDRIRDWLRTEVSAATVAQRLCDEHGVSASESSVRRWISANLSQEAVRTNFLMLQPVWCSIQWLTARAANTMLRWASMESRVWW